MTLAPGTSLGPYEIHAKLGEGGMGEVYRATDTKLRREVAIKVLPAEFTVDEERLARFEREAQLLAQLHHPHIASIFGLEESEGVRALVMELVEGPTLADRLASGPLPVGESLAIARQIAEALEEAHEKGIIHRDLKPQNIKAPVEGPVKVLDFGLAKAMEPASVAGMSPSEIAHSPTVTFAATREGVILGTAAYMSPEQTKGAAVDKRADIWAFGVVLYETLTGRRLFEGDSVPEILAGVLKSEIDLEALPPETPPAIRRLLRRCLERHPRSRLHDVADARIVLDEVASGRLLEPAAATPSASPRRSALWPVAAVLAALAGVAAGWLLRPSPETPEPLRFARLPMPPGTHLALSGIQPGPPAVSPDGTRVAFVAEDDGGLRQLWVRELSEPKARRLGETEGASYPFWSPDGRQLAFFAESRLQRVPLAGGNAVAIADAPSGKGGTWNRDGVILFAPAFNSSIHRVRAEGGPVEEVTRLDRDRGEDSHRFPRFLDDGERFLFLARGSVDSENRVMLGSLDGGEPRELVRTPVNAVAALGDLLYLREGSLLAQRLNVRSAALMGATVRIATDVRTVRGAARMVADVGAGTLVFQTGRDSSASRLVWLDRRGQRLGAIGEPKPYVDPRISPDGRRIVAHAPNPDLGTNDLWIVDVASGGCTRLTFEATNERHAVWSPDGRSVAYAANPAGSFELLVKEVEGQAPPRVLLANDRPDFVPWPQDWTRDGRELVYQAWRGAASVTEIWSIATKGGSAPRKLAESTYREPAVRVSPDARWMVFGTTVDSAPVDSTAPTIVVTHYPEAKQRWQVARGAQAWWSRDGRELYVLDPEGALEAIEVHPRGDSFEWGPPRTLFRVAARTVQDAGDGRFLALESAGEEDPSSNQLELVLGWRKLLETP